MPTHHQLYNHPPTPPDSPPKQGHRNLVDGVVVLVRTCLAAVLLPNTRAHEHTRGHVLVLLMCHRDSQTTAHVRTHALTHKITHTHTNNATPSKSPWVDWHVTFTAACIYWADLLLTPLTNPSASVYCVSLLAEALGRQQQLNLPQSRAREKCRHKVLLCSKKSAAEDHAGR